MSNAIGAEEATIIGPFRRERATPSNDASMILCSGGVGRNLREEGVRHSDVARILLRGTYSGSGDGSPPAGPGAEPR